MKLFNCIYLFLVCLWAASCGPSVPDEIQAQIDLLPEEIDFNIHVKPILSDRCYACHGPDAGKIKAGLQLHTADAANLLLSSGSRAVRPGSLSGSEMYHRIISKDAALVMPPPESNLTLTAKEKAILIKWLDDGAEYKPHWAFVKPEQIELPNPGSKEHPIDQFVNKKLAEQGWQQNEKADPSSLMRRISFDLTGLPANESIRKKVKDNYSNNQIEIFIDQLLASPQYGEHLATNWMDVARYADTHGYTVDRYRDMSPWRDWVIGAFNKNMKYDDFVTWQLAGDLFDHPTKEQRLATAFNRNHQQNMEGGIVQEEFRVEYVADRANTLGTAFLGLTMECARCHDHKFDPITQKNYFEMFSFFNNVNEAGQISWDDAMPVPTMLLTDAVKEEELTSLEKAIQEQVEKLSNYEAESLETWIRSGKLENLLERKLPAGAVAHFDLEDKQLKDKLRANRKGAMKQQYVADYIAPEMVSGFKGNGIKLNGDAWLDLSGAGRYDRYESFSVSMWAKIPAEVENGVIFHKGDGAAIFNFRGYHLALKANQFEVLLAHTYPNNAIVGMHNNVPRDEWVHLGLTYDGSSKAKGVSLYVNGEKAPLEIETDNLYKSILFKPEKKNGPGLQIGARWRGTGTKDLIADEISIYNRSLTQLEMIYLAAKITSDGLSAEELLAQDKSVLREFQISQENKYKNELSILEATRKKLFTEVDGIKEIMVMEEMKSPRQTYILERGVYDAPGDPVGPGTPESVLEFSDKYPKNRLGLAQWLFDEENPLTARVYVNRLWHMFFGRGLVKSLDDFGNQGTLPSHPELLDWMANEFVQSGWDIQHMIKLILTSDAYQQSSLASAEMMELDPENIFIARGPSSRLSAEMLRDNVLASSGLLNDEIGGESVFPYQPDDLWRINGGTYTKSEGDNLYRRSLYTIWKRSVPHPSQATFDAPSRSNCTVMRQETTTPLQALVLLNDPIFNEAARVLGNQINEAGDVIEGIALVFERLTGRMPDPEELDILQRLRTNELEKFSVHPSKMKGWLSTGDYKIEGNARPAEIAANTVVASTIINADATVIKR